MIAREAIRTGLTHTIHNHPRLNLNLGSVSRWRTLYLKAKRDLGMFI